MTESLAVVEVRVPEGAQVDGDVRYLVARTARSLGAAIAYDGDLGLYELTIPASAVHVSEQLDALLQRLAQIEVPHDRYAVRLVCGAGLVGRSEYESRDDALVAAMDLAHASAGERALRTFTVVGGPPSGFLRARYFSMSARRKAWTLALLSIVLAWVIPLGLFVTVKDELHVDMTTVLFWMVFGCVVLTAATVYAEAILALRPAAPPLKDPSPWPAASAVIAAYLPNEADTILDTVQSVLNQDYPGSLEVILAYNTPRPVPVEEELAALAAIDRRLILVRVGDSSSKAQNVNAALQVASGAFVGIFDADHLPMPDAFRRAARWLASGVDVVQGRSVVRNGSSNWLARMVAVEFEGIYAVAHPGRAALHGFGIFGGSNGFWRTEILDQLRMRPDMLTEDIDISIRAVFGGARIAVDPGLISEELAPLTPMALWSQRIRWSQGWHQVSRQQLRRIWRTPALSLRQRLGASFLLGWREAYPWLAAQMIPILAFSLLYKHGIHIQFVLPLFIVATLYVSAVGPIQALFAWGLAVPELRRRRGWWVQYMLVTGTLFGEFKAHVNRAAHVRELIGDRNWQVTPRGRGASPAVSDRARVDARASAVTSMGARSGTLCTVALDGPLGGVAARTLSPDPIG